MKKHSFILFSLLSSLFLLLSCSDDKDKDTLGNFQSVDFVNTWVEFGSDGQYTTLTLANTHRVTGKEVFLEEGALVNASISGTWMYYHANNILLIQTGRVSEDGIQSVHSTTYKVRELANGRMTLTNQETGATDTYYRLAEQLTLKVGAKADADIPAGANCQTSDPDVIAIEEPEGPVAVGSGTAFLLVSTDAGAYVVECKVLHQTEIFTGYIGGSVEAVLEEYGEPDVTGMIGVNMAVLYNLDPATGLKALQVQFDPETLEVTRILVQYSEKSVWESDSKFIASWLNGGDGFYYPEASQLESPFMISNFESNGSYYISYNNITYHLANGHYAPAEAAFLPAAGL